MASTDSTTVRIRKYSLAWRCFALLAVLLGNAVFAQETTSETAPPEAVSDELEENPLDDGIMRAYVIPVKTQIGKPTLFAIRAGIKEAIGAKADIILLDMDTPGGELNVTLDIMKILDRFPGKTVTYVSGDAISAGAIIASVTQEIYFEGKATIGSAEPVSGAGQDIDESMKRKVLGFMKSKLRAYTNEYRYRSEVISAMVDPEIELKIDETIISPKGELLNINAEEAIQLYGDPPEPLLGHGIHDSADDVIKALAGSDTIERMDYHVSWSLELANWLMYINPILLGIGGLLLFTEFKTPGFGIFGISGLICLAIVFFGHNVAGLSGNEPFLIFLLGAALVFIELFFMPGALVMAIPGVLLMLGSLLWGMADIWPSDTPNYEFTLDIFLVPFYNLTGGAIVALILILGLIKFMPESYIWNHLVLSRSIAGTSRGTGEDSASAREGTLVGLEGIAVTDLYPSGEVEIDGYRYSAQLEVGTLEKGERIRVAKSGPFGLIVEKA